MIIDSFVFSVEEIGLSEMQPLLSAGGGLIAQHEEFNSCIFQECFRKAYLGLGEVPPLELAQEAKVELASSREVQVRLLGQEKVGGHRMNSVYWIGGVQETTTIAILCELTEAETEAEGFCLQIRTRFRYPLNLGLEFERVTTIRRLFSPEPSTIAQGFDQEAALALFAKLLVTHTHSDHSSEKTRNWLDTRLCRWARFFGSYQPGQSDSFKLPTNMHSFPQFVFYLRRSCLLKQSGMSLDELKYIQQIIQRETVGNVVQIIQPAVI